MRIGVLCSRIRVEEKLLFAVLEARGVAYEVIEEARLRFDLTDRHRDGFDVVLERCADPWRAAYAINLLENIGLRCVNPYRVTETCGNKLLMTAALARAGVPHPRTMVAFEPEEALSAAEAIGYPVVFKPAVGAWDGLLGKVNDRQGAEAVLEHKEVLGTYHHTIFYAQEFIQTPGRDIRLYVVGDRVLAAIYRQSTHWAVTVARDLTIAPCPLTPELEELAQRSAVAVGGGLVAVDVVEDAQRGPLVIDVAHMQEFRRAVKATGVDIAAEVVDYVLAIAGNASVFPAGLPPAAVS